MTARARGKFQIERWRTHLIVQLDRKQARSIEELAHSMQLQRIRSNVRATAAPRTFFPGPLAILALLCSDGDGFAYGGQMAHPLPKCVGLRNGNKHENRIVLWLRTSGSGGPSGEAGGGGGGSSSSSGGGGDNVRVVVVSQSPSGTVFTSCCRAGGKIKFNL